MIIKLFFNIANSLLFRKQESPLPNTTPLSALAKDFSKFFEGKIDRNYAGPWNKMPINSNQIYINNS